MPGRYLPSAMPERYRQAYKQELIAWSLLPFMLGMLEGGVVGIMAKKSFGAQVDPETLNFIIGILTGLPAIANLTSFAWAAAVHGRPKIRFIVTLQILAALSIASIGLASPSTSGFVIFALAVAMGRIAWAGVITVRTTVWGNNYPRTDRARVAGCFATVQALCLAGVTFLMGLLLDGNPNAYQWAFPAAAAIGLIGILAYSRIHVHDHDKLLLAERSMDQTDRQSKPSLNPLAMISLLQGDKDFRFFMICMFLIGTGNMMVTAPLIVILDEQFNMDYVQAISILTSIPILMMPLSIPIWSRLLDRLHVVRFRSIHSWVFIISNLIFFGSIIATWMPGIWIAAIIRGIGFGGGVLAWNLGHHDFSTPQSSSQYMGVHVTLTGIRGFLAPILGVLVYESLLSWGYTGGGVFLLSSILGLIGALGFLWLGRQLRTPPED
ncbi:MAG: MFS transporter [Phycisphaerales bacterium]|nr:MFS transporter [Phycisphaerales bacterium]